jgi:hypothetical protein
VSLIGTRLDWQLIAIGTSPNKVRLTERVDGNLGHDHKA